MMLREMGKRPLSAEPSEDSVVTEQFEIWADHIIKGTPVPGIKADD